MSHVTLDDGAAHCVACVQEGGELAILRQYPAL